MKRLLLLLALWAPLPACEDDCGSGKVDKYFDVEGIKSQAFRAGTPSQPGGQLSGGETVSRFDLRLEIHLLSRYYSSRHSTSGSQALACSPLDPGYGGSAERVDSLVVFSRYDYDAAHPAGRSLNDLLDASESLQGIQVTPARVGRLDGQPVQHLSLRLTQAPTASSRQQFFVRYRQTNGEVYTAQAPELIITP